MMNATQESKRRTRTAFDSEAIIGERYGRLTITAYRGTEHKPRSDGRQQAARMVECKCDCGNTIVTEYAKLRAGKVSSCGCLHADISAANCVSRASYDPDRIVGEVYGRLTVIGHDHDEKEFQSTRKNGKPKITTRHFVKVRCECGNEFVAPYKLLTAGKLQSCGCLRRDKVAERNRSRGLSEWSNEATMFSTAHPELKLRKVLHDGQASRYLDENGLQVLIPSVKTQQEMYRRKQDAKRNTTG